MGEIIIEMPFDVSRRFRIINPKTAARVLGQLEDLERNGVNSTSIPAVDDEEVLTVWVNRAETPDEIARQLRQGSRRHG